MKVELNVHDADIQVGRSCAELKNKGLFIFVSCPKQKKVTDAVHWREQFYPLPGAMTAPGGDQWWPP